MLFYRFNKLLIVATLALILMQAWNFMGGYRMTADDIYFHNIYFEGLSSVFRNAHYAAISQGRIGQYISVPLVVLGSHWADSILARAMYVGLYFLLFLLFSRFITNLIKAEITLFLFILMISMINLGPEAFNHLPPTAYPLLITIPILIVISLKLWEQSWSKNILFESKDKVVIYALCMLFALLINEYSFLFGVGIFFIQYLISTKKFIPVNKNKYQILFGGNCNVYFDGLVLIAAFIIYCLFRAIFPSTYDGNSPDGLMRPYETLNTLSSHIVSGTSVPFLIGWSTQKIHVLNIKQLLDEASTRQIFNAIAFGICSSSLIFALLRKVADSARLFKAIFATFLFAIITSFPAAITLKYQNWCPDTCIYINTRISYFGLVATLGLFTLTLLSKISSKSNTLILRVTFASLIGILATHTYLYNEIINLSMQRYAQVWDRAKLYACSHLEISNDPNLLQTIEANNLIFYHPNFPVNVYWMRYMQNYKKHNGCH